MDETDTGACSQGNGKKGRGRPKLATLTESFSAISLDASAPPLMSSGQLSSTANSAATGGPAGFALVEQLLEALSDRRIIEALRAALVPSIAETFNRSLSKLSDEVDALKQRVAHLESLGQGAGRNWAEVARPDSGESGVTSINRSAGLSNNPRVGTPLTLATIHKEMAEKQKRAANVIVYGLSAVQDKTDVELFAEFMENNLAVKPAFNRDSLRRIGKGDGGKVRPLLVTMSSSIAAADVIASAKDRRNTLKPVYINPDLTPAEAQAAFEQRVQRRERRQHNLASSSSNTSSRFTARSLDVNSQQQSNQIGDRSNDHFVNKLSISANPFFPSAVSNMEDTQVKACF